jgi:hypothetical protein
MSVPLGRTSERPTFTNELRHSTTPLPSLHTEHVAEMRDDPQSAKRAAEIVAREQTRAAKERGLAAEQRSHARDERAKS